MYSILFDFINNTINVVIFKKSAIKKPKTLFLVLGTFPGSMSNKTLSF